MNNQKPVFWVGHAAALFLAFQLEWLSPLYGFIALAIAILVGHSWQWPPRWWWPLGAFGLWQLISISWSDHPAEGWGDVGLIAPLVLLSTLAAIKGVRWEHPLLLMRTFAWGVVLQWTFVFFLSILQNGWVNYKDFELLSRLDLHYQSLYMVVAVLILERQFWVQNTRYKFIYIIAGLWLLFGIITLSARIHLLAVPVLIAARAVELAWKKPERRNYILTQTMLGLVLGVLVLVALPGPRNRIIDLRNELRSIDGKVDGKQTNHRVFIWSYGAEVVRDHALLGTGNGAEDWALHEKLKGCEAPFYKGQQAYYLYDEVYDYHNILLQTTAEGGPVALVLMIALLIWGFKNGNGVVRWAWVAFIITGMTESLLDRQAGAFLLTFLAFVIQTGYTRTNSGQDLVGNGSHGLR